MKINAEAVTEAAFGLLDEAGLDGLSMRLVAARLTVQPGALYWHVKNKQELLERMASAIFTDAAEDLEAPRANESWQDWLADWARRLRQAMLRHRDGAMVFAGNSLKEPAVFRATELTLRTLQDAGFAIQPAARSVSALLHYTVGFTIEEQAHTAAAPQADPHAATSATSDARYPLTAQAYTRDDLFDPDTDDCFEYGLTVIIRGMQAVEAAPPSPAEGREPTAR
jgi:TetR/AcrR family tetracycline transcriptional repressor